MEGGKPRDGPQGTGVHIHLKGQILLGAAHAYHGHDGAEQLLYVILLLDQMHLAGLYLGHIQKVIDK